MIRRASIVLVSLCLASAALADRAAVEGAMRAMERAVLAGDEAAYLAHIAAADPIFHKEQQNWAKDLRLHVPSAFTLTIAEPAPEPDEDAEGKDEDRGVMPPVFDDAAGLARLELVMDWTMRGLGRGGKDLSRTVSFPVTFVRAPSSPNEPERWLYQGEEWLTVESRPGADTDEAGRRLSTAPNRCRHFPGFEETAAGVVGVLPEVRAHVDEGFENPIAHVQEVKIYPSMRHLQASIYLSYVDGLGGWNEPGESIKLLSSRHSGKPGLRVLLAHEYGHVATFELGPSASGMPWWTLEGVAELAAERFAVERAADRAAGDGGPPPAGPRGHGREAHEAVDRWARAGELAPWADLTDFRSVPRNLGGHVYKQGQHMLGHISERFGRTKRNAWLRAMARGASIDEASRRELGVGFAGLDEGWRATLPGPEPADDPVEAAAPSGPASPPSPRRRRPTLPPKPARPATPPQW